MNYTKQFLSRIFSRELDDETLESDIINFYEKALEQDSSSENLIYHRNLLISEIIKQESGMICLASKYMLIVDIDCGENTGQPLETLFRWVNRNGGSFRVYKTKNGMRYLQTDIIYQGVNSSALQILFDLGSDPNYINFCQKGGRFMARLSPKLSTSEIENYFTSTEADRSVCHFLATVGFEKITDALKQTIAIHDIKTLFIRNDLPLS